MLFALHIRNIALLDDVEIEFQNGLNVLTGETGAGKSILIHSINLLLGDRANRDLIRHGADRAEVTGLFYIEDSALQQQLSEKGIETEEDGSLIISRSLLRDGKNLCRIGGRVASLSELKDLACLLVNIHGQHDSQALLDPSEHIHFLDGFLKEAGMSALAAYQDAYHAWQTLQRKADSLQMDEAERLRKIDMLQYEVNEIRAAALQDGEEEDLKKRRDILHHKMHLQENIGRALAALCDGNEQADARQALSIASRALESAADLDESLAPLCDTLFAVMEETETVSRSLRNYFDRMSEDDASVDDVEARLDVLYHLKRKYGDSISAILAHADAAEAELSLLQNAETQKEQMSALLKEAEEKAQKKAEILSELRQKSIPEIESAINENLHFLNMPDADFRIVVTPEALSRFGAEQIHFEMKTNAGEAYLPLTKIVSGGELSRMMLAIKSVLTDGDSIPTLIFDEIDTGVSGSTAQKIGRKLRTLSQNKQVLCVTHLAQIAAMADTHFLIDKASADGRTKTNVFPLNQEDRVKELSRIISGDAITETTLKQAEELIHFGQLDS